MRVLIPLLLAAAAFAEQRPRITGVAHVALFVKDIEQSRTFYKTFLGYAEPFDLRNPDGTLALTFIKINDRQYVELFPERAAGTDRLHHISLEVEDADAMRRYLAGKGVKVPASVPTGRIGNRNFSIQDPDGHGVEFVEYTAKGWSRREQGRHQPGSRISQRMLHAGILVGSTSGAMRFYGDLLGFEEIWRGSRDPKALQWINMRVPDGTDYVEFMLYQDLPAPAARGTQHHICLEVPDMDAAVAELRKRPGYARGIEIRTGVNRRRQANLFDPDGTRIELMEPRTVDGNPPPVSQAPPPRP